VFDEDKLAWANRHYLKLCAPERLAALSEPYLRERGFLVSEPTGESKAWLEWILPNVAGSVDRLPQVADRVESVFRWRAPAIPDAEETIVAPVLAEVLLDTAPLVDRETFRTAANRVKERTGLKGKALFHPIRTILTGAQEGPELDVIVPAIDRAVDVPGLAFVISCKDRAAAVANLL
jgi:glutamyl/glutaminyl-tRNA synthetase